MKRRVRVERRLLLALEDGSTLTLGPGDCWLDEDAATPILTWKVSDGQESGAISAAELRMHLNRRDLVFTSW